MAQPINLVEIDRYWFLTWTTYGSWLPGDARGFVGSQLGDDNVLIEHNQFGTPLALPNAALHYVMGRQTKESTVVLDFNQATSLLEQFLETTSHRRWLLIALGIMRTHIHAVVGVPGDPDPEKVLGDLKAYGSRCLKANGAVRDNWWTRSGSKRKLSDEAAVNNVVHYICGQANPLLIWTRADGIVHGPQTE